MAIEIVESNLIGKEIQIYLGGVDFDADATPYHVIGALLVEDIRGGPDDDTLNGGGYDDTIYGEDGNDTINGLLGNDTIYGDDVTEGPGDGRDYLRGYHGNDVLHGGGDNDRLYGEKHNDQLFGGSGNDMLNGGEGKDALDGGSGVDTASYSTPGEGPVVASLANASINTGPAAGDTYVSIENLIGSWYGDHLNGNHAANSINGGRGNDYLKGYGGNDLLTGGSAQDVFIFNSTLDGANNVDTITDFGDDDHGADPGNYTWDDAIWLDDAVFTALSPGALAATAFKDLADGAKDADDRIVYNSATGNLYYDADGSGAAFGNIKFATMANLAELTAVDFLVI
ncbi:calcium-binding protein [Mesorhizobium sp. CN2-181]|uniref:calcium-binding protein n=1 Tax=Mesorhizobium yinganensis TaxID=3157707 RepID=UPI0032B72BEF